MDGNGLDFSKILKMVTDNPAMLQTALSFAGKLKDSTANTPPVKDPPPAEVVFTPDQPVLKKETARDNERQLLLALRPYLSEARQEKIDFVLKILQLLELAGNLGLNFDTKTKGSDTRDV